MLKEGVIIVLTKTREKGNKMTTFNPGDILLYDAGYSMLLPHFAIVESITPSGKSVRIRELATEFVPDDRYGQTGYKTPTQNVSGKQKTCRLTKYGQVKIDSHYARLWDGRPARYDSMD